MPYYVYILKSLQDNTYYIGQTANLEARLTLHNKGRCRATKGRTPWQLVYCETFASRKKAFQRERQIKAQKHRSYIESLIQTG